MHTTTSILSLLRSHSFRTVLAVPLKSSSSSSGSGTAFYPKVAQYGPFKVDGLKEGQTKFWCQCGLSKTQPWCDSSHKGTSFRPLKWTVSSTKDKYFLCGCKYTKHAPLCDGQHTKVESLVKERQQNCNNRDKHAPSTKLCPSCGWAPQ